MTLREEIQLRIRAIKQKAAAEVAALQEALDSNGPWLDKDLDAVREELAELALKVRAKG